MATVTLVTLATLATLATLVSPMCTLGPGSQLTAFPHFDTFPKSGRRDFFFLGGGGGDLRLGFEKYRKDDDGPGTTLEELLRNYSRPPGN